MVILKSELDKSVNIIETAKVGYFESRYVRRTDDYFIIYLSSQSGCDQACRFCFLTRTGQVKYINANYQDFLTQAKKVFDVYSQDQPAKAVHFNFMSRGEPLNNLEVDAGLLIELGTLAKGHNLVPQFKISTIMPKSLQDTNLAFRFAPAAPDIYYSLYTMNQEYRKIWLPKARCPEESLDILKEYQEYTGKIIRLHWAPIAGVNDSKEELDKIIEAVCNRDLLVYFNFVRYNSYDSKYGREPEENIIQENLKYLLSNIPGSKGKIVPRVGFDVYASCGMFYEGKENEKNICSS